MDGRCFQYRLGHPIDPRRRGQGRDAIDRLQERDPLAVPETPRLGRDPLGGLHRKDPEIPRLEPQSIFPRGHRENHRLDARPPMTGQELRRLVIEISLMAKVGHISSALCICDILSVLYGKVLRNPGTPDRDRFILSKGHAALALYVALHKKGLLDRKELETFCADGSRLGVHPEFGAPGVEVSTGSLGMGLSVGAGLALSAKLRKSPWRVYVLMSDAECDEGSVWEAAMFASHHRLQNLTVIIDDNGFQAFGRTEKILNLQPLEERWRSFGWEASTVDGHDEAALAKALADPSGKPRVLIAKTISGKGVSFMENKLEWHYYPVNEEQARQALRELGGAS